MIHTLPGNRLEDLVDPLVTLLRVPTAHPLEPDRILVQHPGMAHWLSLRLAEHPERRVAMNLEYPLPVTQMWSLIRTILGPERVPERSPYEREILTWRLFEALGAPAAVQDPDLAEPTRYWRDQSPRQQPLRRFQLAGELADLYEQYLLYRPDWILDWDRGESTTWQGRLWQRLTSGQPDHPVRLLRQAHERLPAPAGKLPERLFLFGLNTLAPLWLDFMRAVSAQAGVDFHVFYLNPSDEYWEDVVSEKRQARQRAHWVASGAAGAGEGAPAPPLLPDAGNPLLGALGGQGQEFVRLLSERADLETPVFTDPPSGTLLGQLQADVLHLRDGREAPSDRDDASIEIVSAHSALREVQALHDWLLHRFNEDPTLRPGEVAVLCPNVEAFAPFVEAVFADRREDLAETVPPLPCSIADRNPGAADPAVAAFLELLELPDARFQVSQVVGWLQVPAIRERFGLDGESLQRITRWLREASVHWGLDAAHKAQWVPGGGVSDHFTWGQGLERLLLGFAWGDQEVLVGDRLLLPAVEGEDAAVLGRLIAFLRTLRAVREAMQQPRSVPEWQTFLQERLCTALFQSGGEYEAVQEDLQGVIRELGEVAGHAGFTGEVPLPVVRHVLEQRLQAPARTGRQFLIGQVTVCSMVPMRSIPFRIIAILGLNDGDFPRQRPPLGFDLMAEADEPARPGDRSRRGDDRYLFLEALLSARERLYLSYQGRDVKTNTERQPSLVLGELMSYLEGASGWSRSRIRVLPLQPYSPENYRQGEGGFDGDWLRLAQPGAPPERVVELPEPDWPGTLDLSGLLRTLADPARAFAEQRLGLYLRDPGEAELADSEPFTTDHLTRYQLQQQLVEARLHGGDASAVLARARHSGELPAHFLAEEALEAWREDADAFAGQLAGCHVDRAGPVSLEVTLPTIRLSGEVSQRPDGTVIHWRLANPKGKDYLTLWLQHLLANTHAPAPSLGLYRGEAGRLGETWLPALAEPQARAALQAMVDLWREALTRPLPLHASLIGELARSRSLDDREKVRKAVAGAWETNPYSGRNGLDRDPFIAWFWPGGMPDAGGADGLAEAMEQRYGDLLDALRGDAGDADGTA